MHTQDIFKTTAELLDRDDRLAMATIIRTQGSTPAGILSKMLVRPGAAETIGTVGGGCMEADIIRDARSVLETGRAAVSTHTLTEDDVDHGLICGGRLEVLVEPLDRSLQPLFQAIADWRKAGRDGTLATPLDLQSTGRKLFLRDDGTMLGELPENVTVDAVTAAAREVSADRKQRTRRLEEPAPCFIEHVPGFPHLVIFGGGHCSYYIARFAKGVGFAVTVVDDRVRYANRDRFPDADETIAGPWDTVVDGIDLHANSYVVIVTRGHNFDEHILNLVLRREPRYVGMIGSKRKVTTTFNHLLEQGVPEDKIRQVFAPMGLDLGCETTEEIGLSVAAELVKVRRGGGSDSVPHMRDRVKRE